LAKRPTMPKSDPNIAALFERLLPTDERIVIRPMFGHKAAFVNGHMFTGTFGKCVFVRLDEPSRVELLTVAGAKPFEPMAGRPMKEYVQLPESFLNEPPKATAWLERALHWTSTLPAKGSQKRGTTSGRRSRTNVGRSK
jgi:TfoX/Sxy family transcriptional regulator of competence genes